MHIVMHEPEQQLLGGLLLASSEIGHCLDVYDRPSSTPDCAAQLWKSRCRLQWTQVCMVKNGAAAACDSALTSCTDSLQNTIACCSQCSEEYVHPLKASKYSSAHRLLDLEVLLAMVK